MALAVSMLSPEIEGLGLLNAPMAMAEFLRDTDKLAMRPRARMALPVFWRISRSSSSRSSKQQRAGLKR